MGLSIRPVIEKWGESLSYISRETGIDDLFYYLATLAEEDTSIKDGAIICEPSDYADMRVVYISNATAFLNWLKLANLESVLDRLAKNGQLSLDEEEYARQKDDLEAIISMAETWQSSIDPINGGIRFYCD